MNAILKYHGGKWRIAEFVVTWSYAMKSVLMKEI